MGLVEKNMAKGEVTPCNRREESDFGRCDEVREWAKRKSWKDSATCQRP